MVNPFKDINWKPDLVERRKFARNLSLGFPIVAVVWFVIILLVTGKPNYPFLIYTAVVGTSLGAVLYALPQIALPFYCFWFFISCCIATVVSNLLLVIFFYLILTPVGLLMRLIGRQPVQRAPDKQAATYWRDVDQVQDNRRYFSQF
jgi:hypothetical protein